MSFDYKQVYALVREVPRGEVASYGMIASLLPGVTARMVGRALAHLSDGTRTPWQRIVNSSGAIAERPGAGEQRKRLVKEGAPFRKNGNVDIKRCLWRGPSQKWIDRNGRDPLEVMEITAGWGR